MKATISSPFLAIAIVSLLIAPTLQFAVPHIIKNNKLNTISQLFSTTPSGSDDAFHRKQDQIDQFNFPYDPKEPRSSEFGTLPPLPTSATRLSRLEYEQQTYSIYIPSGTDRYWDLMDEISQLETELKSGKSSIAGLSKEAEMEIKTLLKRKRAKDPEHMYRVASEAASMTKVLGREEEAERYHKESLRARRFLPQFNLEGLWVGKYGSHGLEMINVTYSGDKLIAYKVTGDQNIPRGEITFTADLTPQHPSTNSKKWGRYHGQGHAAEPGFCNAECMEGQLVVIGEGEYFSFEWIPLDRQLHFGRPSPELTIKMLREGGGTALTAGIGSPVPSLDAGLKDHLEYVGRCLEVTTDELLDEMVEGKVDPFSCIWHGNEDWDQRYFE